MRHSATRTVSETADATAKMIAKAKGYSANGNATFIPKKLDTIVGRLTTIVIDAKTFITTFKLFEIIDAKASIIELRMLLEMFVISIAC